MLDSRKKSRTTHPDGAKKLADVAYTRSISIVKVKGRSAPALRAMGVSDWSGHWPSKRNRRHCRPSLLASSAVGAQSQAAASACGSARSEGRTEKAWTTKRRKKQGDAALTLAKGSSASCSTRAPPTWNRGNHLRAYAAAPPQHGTKLRSLVRAL